MKVLIVEDEKPAAGQMADLIQMYDKSIEILPILDSVKDVVKWVKTNPLPNLIFMDIQLADGLSFEIFDKVQVECPVIFTTAYQEYAIKAFKVNSVDYLLKPIDFTELKNAIEKFKKHFNTGNETFLKKEIFKSVKQILENPYKTRFVIRVGEHIRTINTTDIHYFFSREKTTNICTSNARYYIIDYSLERLAGLLNPMQFFRVSRQNIVNREAIADIVVYSKNRLKIVLSTPGQEPLIVSRDKVNAFKQWLDG